MALQDNAKKFDIRPKEDVPDDLSAPVYDPQRGGWYPITQDD